MPVVSLSAEFVRNVVCPEGKKKVNYYDSSITGFILEVRATGGKTYALRYRDPHNRQRQYKIGDANSLSYDKAKNKGQRIKSRIILGENPEPRKRVAVPTVEEFAYGRYLPFVKGYRRDVTPDVSMLRCHVIPRFGKVYLDEVLQQDVIEYHHQMVTKLGLAKGTANRMLVLMRYALNLAVRWEVIKVNPVADAKLYMLNNARERFLTVPETKRLIEATRKSNNPRLTSIVTLLLFLGCRKRELFDSKWEDFDLERKIWNIPLAKSGRGRHVPLSDAAIDILLKLPKWEGCPYVIPNPMTMKPFVRVYQSWNIARIEAGLPDVRMHDLRHSMASNMVNSGRSLYEVSKVLGHSQLRTTERYAHLSQATLLDAVNAAAKATGVG